jgi:hypothetical protein
MSLFQLDPASIVARVHTASEPVAVPSLGSSLLRGAIGFAIVSVAGFAPWPIFDLWLRIGGENTLYLACTAVFIGLSSPLLHRLIIGPDSFARFYKLFTLAFIPYVIIWVTLWKTLRFGAGEILGLFGGTLAMSVVLAFAFDAWKSLIPAAVAIFTLNALGYYAGGWVYREFAAGHHVVAMLLWGASFGTGLGAGLGLAFYFCQSRVRAMLRSA